MENTSLCLGEGAGLLAGSLLQESALISYRSQLLAALAGRAFCDVDCMEKFLHLGGMAYGKARAEKRFA